MSVSRKMGTHHLPLPLNSAKLFGHSYEYGFESENGMIIAGWRSPLSIVESEYLCVVLDCAFERVLESSYVLPKT